MSDFTTLSGPSFRGMWGGLDIVENPHLDDGRRWVQVKFPRTKRRRIRRKWAKRRVNFAMRQVEEPQCFEVGGRIICAPRVAAGLRRALRDDRCSGLFNV